MDLVGNGVIRSSKIDFMEMGLYRWCMSQTGDARIVAMGKGTSTWVRRWEMGKPVIDVSWVKDVEGIKTVMKFKNNILYDYMMTSYKTLYTI